MPKHIFYGNEARNKLKAGVDKLGDAVKTSLGPKGRNSVIYRGYGFPIVTKDGVSIAKEIEVEDRAEQMGVELVRQAALKTNDSVGDGTTTSTVLAQEIIRLALEKLSTDPTIDVHAMRSEMEARVEAICAELDRTAVKIDGDVEKLTQVATISANNDPIVGKLIAELMAEVGKEGVVTVEDSPEIGVKVERVEGLQYARGYVTPYLMTDAERQVAELGDPAVIVTDYRVTTAQELVALIKPALDAGRKDIFLIAEALEGDALTVAVANGPMFKKNFNVVATTPPGYGDRKKEMLSDICALTGAKLVSLELGRKLETVTEADYGSCSRVTVEADKTTIVGGKGDKEEIAARLASIKATLKKKDLGDFDKEKLSERLAKLQGGVAVIKVGALTEVEAKEKRYLIEDAVNAVKAAMQEGIVAGGGMALAKIVESQDGILKVACLGPFHMIVTNAGKDSREVWNQIAPTALLLGAVESDCPGYDAKSGEIVKDMIAAGIVDPVSVTKSALRNAFSVAASILTTETLIVEIPENKAEKTA